MREHWGVRPESDSDKLDRARLIINPWIKAARKLPEYKGVDLDSDQITARYDRLKPGVPVMFGMSNGPELGGRTVGVVGAFPSKLKQTIFGNNSDGHGAEGDNRLTMHFTMRFIKPGDSGKDQASEQFFGETSLVTGLVGVDEIQDYMNSSAENACLSDKFTGTLLGSDGRPLAETYKLAGSINDLLDQGELDQRLNLSRIEAVLRGYPGAARAAGLTKGLDKQGVTTTMGKAALFSGAIKS